MSTTEVTPDTNMSGFAGFDYFKAGRFSSPVAVYSVYEYLKTEDLNDAARRAKIKRVYDLFLPYNPEDLRRRGHANLTNVNFGGLRGAIDARSEVVTRLSVDTCDLVELDPLGGGAAGPDDDRISAVVAEEFSAAVRRSGHLIPALAMMNREADLYGLGPVTWADDETYEPVALERGQVRFRPDGPVNSADHEIIMFESDFPAAYLFSLLDHPLAAKENGWNIAELKTFVDDVLKQSKDTRNIPGVTGGVSPVESNIEFIRRNAFYESNQFRVLSVLHVFVREMKSPRGITHIIIPGNGVSKDFLYKKENAYRTMDECFIWFPYTVCERYARSVRGIASTLLPIDILNNRFTGAMFDAGFRSASLILQQASPGVMPANTINEVGPYTTIASGLTPVPNAQAAAPLQGLAQMRQLLDQLGPASVAGIELAPTAPRLQLGGEQPSKAEAEIMERRRTSRDENLFAQRVTVLDRIFSETFRRFLKIAVGPEIVRREYPFVEEFVKNCGSRGVTPAMLKEIPEHFIAVSCRDMIIGMDGKISALGQILGNFGGTIDEPGRKAAIHDIVRSRLGRKAAERYAPEEARDSAPSDQASFATMENNFLQAGQPVLVGPDQRHWSHIPVHAQILQQIQQTVAQGMQAAQEQAAQQGGVPQNQQGELAPQIENPEQLAAVLEATSKHIQEHLAIGGQQLGMKDKAKQVAEMLRGLAPVIKALNLAVATQRRVKEAEQERQQRELEDLQKKASEAEMQKAKYEADRKAEIDRYRADLQHQERMREIELKAQEGQVRLQQEGDVKRGRAQLDAEAARGRLQIQSASAKAAADRAAEASRADAERKASESANEQMLAAAKGASERLESSQRTSGVTGQAPVPPSAVASPQGEEVAPEDNGAIPY